MKNIIKFSCIACFAVLVAVCGYFLLTQNTPKTTIVASTEASAEGFTSSPVYPGVVKYVEDPTPVFAPSAERFGAPNPNILFSVKTYSVMTYDVVFMNFKNLTVFTEENYTTYVEKFDKVRDYFDIHSRGKTQVLFNYYLYNSNHNSNICKISSSYGTEVGYIKEGIERGYKLSGGDNGIGKILMVAYDKSVNRDALAHPHVWMPSGSSSYAYRPMFINSNSGWPTYVHELYHTMGLGDLYSCINLDTTLCENEVMGNSLEFPTCAYNKQLLGWAKESTYEDNITTEIETISKQGRYILSLPEITTGTIAYKFGENGSEAFYAEYRNYKSDDLFIYRVNERYTDNTNARSKATCHIATINNISGLNKKTDALQINPKDYPITYSNGTKLNVSIGNISYPSEGTIAFDFFFGESADVEVSLDIINKNKKNTKINCEIFVNGVFVTNSNNKTDICVTQGDIVDVVAEGYYSHSFIVNAENINLNNTNYNYTIELISENSPAPKYTFSFYIKMAKSNFEIPINEVSFYVNNMPVNYNNGLRLLEGDKIVAKSNYWGSTTLTFVNQCLHFGQYKYFAHDGNFEISEHFYHRSIYLKLYNTHEELSSISAIKIYNEISDSWELQKNARIQYKGAEKYYCFSSISNFNKMMIEYDAFGVKVSKIIDIIPCQDVYVQKFEKDILHVAGAFVSNMFQNIGDFFKSLFN